MERGELSRRKKERRGTSNQDRRRIGARQALLVSRGSGHMTKLTYYTKLPVSSRQGGRGIRRPGKTENEPLGGYGGSRVPVESA